ncbi:histidine--tRNA ligase [Brevibacillus ginsengisoli]|uniref:histidine--tRNA ligase n=1 Tax=Brevibacillus ginsengisoli TaxID=363854 RepID=UPI003CEDC66F
MEEMLRNVKGTKDYLPEEQTIRTYIRRTLEEVFEQYAYKPLETPILNYYDLLASKYGGGEEILKEVYKLSDQGERELALRYDLTIPVAKVIGMNPDIRLPFKRYEIGKVFRDGPMKAGRFREFTQCDVDVVGVTSVLAEAELLVMAVEVFQRLKLNVKIQYNNRKVLTGILLSFEVAEERLGDVILTLDKVEKIGIAGVKEELNDKQIEQDTIERITQFIQADNGNTLEYIGKNFSQPLVVEGLRELMELREYVTKAGVESYLQFNPFLARGLNIYTGSVYEIFLTEGRITSSIGSGGRYDKIIGQLLGNDQSFPAVGLSFGLDVIYAALLEKGQLSSGPLTEILIVPIGTQAESLQLATRLRRQGLRVEIEMSGKRVKKALDYANKEEIPFVLLLGQDELARGEVTLRSMREGIEERVGLSEVEEKLNSLMKNFQKSTCSVMI